MSFILAPFKRLLADFISDVKSSWRFKVAAILWIPLFVTVMVAVVSLGERNHYSLLTPDWRTHWVNEDNGINFPDVTIGFSNPNSGATFSGVACSQRGVFVQNPSVCGSVPQTCYSFSTSQFVAAASTQGQNHVTCNLIILGPSSVNTEMSLTVPQGYIWQPNPPTVVLPNLGAEVDFYRETFHTMDGKSASEWFTNVVYQTSDFYVPSPSGFNATIILRLPVRAQINNYQYISFDNWMLLAAWGGVIFFMWFLHGIVYGLAKLWLPNDSKLLPAPEATSAYEPIK